MFHGVASRIRKNHLPTSPRVAATPQRCIRRVNHLWVCWIEYECRNRLAKIEHAPRLATVARDVIAGHVAVLNYRTGIVRADGWKICSAPAAWTDDCPARCSRTLTMTGNCDERQQDRQEKGSSNLHIRIHSDNYPTRPLSLFETLEDCWLPILTAEVRARHFRCIPCAECPLED